MGHPQVNDKWTEQDYESVQRTPTFNWRDPQKVLLMKRGYD
jgi:hypothetical protein